MSTPSAETLATLATIRAAIEAESVSYGELAELQSLADQPEVRSWIIGNGEVELAQWADIPEAEFHGSIEEAQS